MAGTHADAARRYNPGVYQVWVGLYHPTSGVRWQTAVSDRFLLGSITVTDK
ncbi:MAG: hypothetical protein R3E31_00720 [Chloroflexota bacterium]